MRVDMRDTPLILLIVTGESVRTLTLIEFKGDTSIPTPNPVSISCIAIPEVLHENKAEWVLIYLPKATCEGLYSAVGGAKMTRVLCFNASLSSFRFFLWFNISGLQRFARETPALSLSATFNSDMTRLLYPAIPNAVQCDSMDWPFSRHYIALMLAGYPIGGIG